MDRALAAVALVTIAALGTDSAARAEVLQVDQNDPRRFQTIQDAVDAANHGDTIMIGEGEYAGAVVDKSVHIRGSGNSVITSGVQVATDPWPYGTRGFYITVDGAKITHLAIENVGIGIDALDVVSVDQVTVSHVTIANGSPAYRDRERTVELASFGVFNYWGGSGWTITHNSIGFDDRYSGYGIYIGYGEENLIAFNEIRHEEKILGNKYYFGAAIIGAQSNKAVHNTIVIDANAVACVGLGLASARFNRIGFNDFRSSSVPGVAVFWGASADENSITANLGENRRTISHADAARFKPILELE